MLQPPQWDREGALSAVGASEHHREVREREALRGPYGQSCWQAGRSRSLRRDYCRSRNVFITA